MRLKQNWAFKIQPLLGRHYFVAWIGSGLKPVDWLWIGDFDRLKYIKKNGLKWQLAASTDVNSFEKPQSGLKPVDWLWIGIGLVILIVLNIFKNGLKRQLAASADVNSFGELQSGLKPVDWCWIGGGIVLRED